MVHINAGFAALVAAYILGPRSNTSNSDTGAHNIPFVLLGAGLLWFGWFGWFGFNAGSSLAADGLASLAFVTTILAAAASMCTWTSISWMRGKPSSATGSAIAAVLGLVTITPAAGFVTPGSAIIIGIIGCVVSYSILEFHLMPAKVDDTLDVFACHGVAGLTGCILTGIFATTSVNAGRCRRFTLWQSRIAGKSAYCSASFSWCNCSWNDNHFIINQSHYAYKTYSGRRGNRY